MPKASGIYETLEFTGQATDEATTYLQWHATAFGGASINGVTVLERDPDGRIISAAIHHRPLDVALRFSSTLRHRLAGIVLAEHFIGRRDEAVDPT